MNKRIRAKKAHQNPKDPVQEAWDVVAEALAATGAITFFAGPDYGGDFSCFKLHNLEGFTLVSKPVRR
jgi:hypothetical protein